MSLEFAEEGPIRLAPHGDTRGLALENNQWGRARNGAQGHQSMWYDRASGEVGWRWKWEGAAGGRVTAYPEVFKGHKPWDRRETLGRIQDTEALSVDYAFETIADGTWNAAFDLWLTRSATAHEDELTAEVMVWVGRDPEGALRPCGGDAIRRWTDRGVSLHQDRPLNRAPIYSFVLDEPAWEGHIDLRWYLGVLIEWGRISATDSICAVEFGNEIVNGGGRTTVRRFDVTHRPA
jgi:hypothetical protein